WVRKGRLLRLAELWVNGVDVDWRLLPQTAEGRPLPLPGVPFARVRLWPTSTPGVKLPAPPLPAKGATPLPTEEPVRARSADTVLEQVRAAVAELLHLAGPEAVHPDQELRRYGFDSLSALRLLNRLAPDTAHFGDRRALLELRTARAWASRLADAAATAAAAAATAAPATAGPEAKTEPTDLRTMLEALAAGRMSPDQALARSGAAPRTGER
ncbi:MAG: phosphopantetheine-binding protein, partial [Byssovorax sp.]